MKRFLMSSFILFSTFAFVACSPGGDDSDKSGNEKFRELQKSYLAVSGSYVGQLKTTDGREIAVLLKLSTETESAGRTADGKERLIPVLKAVYDQGNLTGCKTLQMSANYTDKSGELILVGKEPAAGVIGFNIDSRVAGDLNRITGYLSSQDWFNGSIALTRITDGSSGTRYLIDQRKKFFKALAAKYELQLKPRSDRAPGLGDVDIWVNTATGVDDACVSLGGLFTSTSYLPIGGSVAAAVNYQAYSNILSISNLDPKAPLTFSLAGKIDNQGLWSGDGSVGSVLLDFKTLSKQ